MSFKKKPNWRITHSHPLFLKQSQSCRVLFSPLQSPRRGSPPAPRWQRRPLMWSQGRSGPQSWLYCWAHTLQQPHSSNTQLTPSGQEGRDGGHEHGREQPRAACGNSARDERVALHHIQPGGGNERLSLSWLMTVGVVRPMFL